MQYSNLGPIFSKESGVFQNSSQPNSSISNNPIPKIINPEKNNVPHGVSVKLPGADIFNAQNKSQGVYNNEYPSDNDISASKINKAHASFDSKLKIPEERAKIFKNNSSANYAKLNMGAVLSLASFCGFVFLAAVFTTVVLLIRR